MFEDMILKYVLTLPQVQIFLTVLLAWTAIGLSIAKTIEGLVVALRPLAKMTKTLKDDNFLDFMFYWSDALSDVMLPASLYQFRKVIGVLARIREDIGKPILKRRLS